MTRRVTLSDIELRSVRQRMLLDDVILHIPLDKLSILLWWVDCEEINPESANARYKYSAHVELLPEISDWCERYLTGFPTFTVCDFPQPDYEQYLKPYVEAPSLELHFLSHSDAMLFKLRWF
jgi:hypothetical protein